METTEIKLVQKPVIQHALVEVGKSVTLRILELNLENLIATEDTVKSLKTLRAELNKEFEGYELQRKAIKDAVSNPYLEFDAVYKAEISEKYKKAVETLKDKIAIVEDKIKAEKKAIIVRYFNELCASENIDFLKFENVGIEINLSTSEKQYREKCNEFVQRVSDDILLIQAQNYAAEIMAEYKNTLNASKAITAVVARKEAEKLEADRIKQAEINRRSTLLRGINFYFSDMTKTFNWVSDENVNVSLSDVENLSKEEFQKLFVKVEALTKVKEPESVLDKPAPEIKAPEPIKAPTIIEPAKQEPTFTASFECVGTMAQLMALKAYLIENKITYKNI
jgi:hypothetical protein